MKRNKENLFQICLMVLLMCVLCVTGCNKKSEDLAIKIYDITPEDECYHFCLYNDGLLTVQKSTATYEQKNSKEKCTEIYSAELSPDEYQQLIYAADKLAHADLKRNWSDGVDTHYIEIWYHDFHLKSMYEAAIDMMPDVLDFLKVLYSIAPIDAFYPVESILNATPKNLPEEVFLPMNELLEHFNRK